VDILFIDDVTAILLPLPEFIDLDFAKTSPKRSLSVIENGRFGLVFAKTMSINSGTGVFFMELGKEQKIYINQWSCFRDLSQAHESVRNLKGLKNKEINDIMDTVSLLIRLFSL
jgi:hypothetical protein